MHTFHATQRLITVFTKASWGCNTLEWDVAFKYVSQNGSNVWEVTGVSGRFTSEEVLLKRRMGGPRSGSDRFGKTNLAPSRNRTSFP